jgi:hypothetical protein
MVRSPVSCAREAQGDRASSESPLHELSTTGTSIVSPALQDMSDAAIFDNASEAKIKILFCIRTDNNKIVVTNILYFSFL